MKIRSILIGLLAGLLFGIATPLSKIILSHLNSFQLAGLLYLGAALAYCPFIMKNWRTEFTALRQTGKKKYLAGVILFGGILGPLFLMGGLKTANAMSVSIWLNMELVATAVLGILIFKDSLDRYAIIGIFLTLSAGIIVSTQESSSGLVSAIFILLACISWGVDNHFSAIIDGVSPQTITFVKGIFGGITNFTIGMFLSNWQIQLNYIPVALLIGVISYGISIVLYVISAQNLGATRSQILFSTAPFWGIIAAWIFIGEPLTLMVLISFSLLVSGIVFTNLGSHEHDHYHKSIVHIHLHSHDDGHHDHTHIDKVEKSSKHSHIHEHKEITHAHKHYPDIHHRHEH
jgi:Permeases of the drug/metabolite transporter (DMT) superfamily